jgi:outer membrane protein TolC
MPAGSARALSALSLAACVTLAGCLSPQEATERADAAVYSIIEDKQQAALGQTEDFTIEELEDRLRRKLMLEQNLPVAGEASFGREYLSPVPKQPDGVSADLPLPEQANLHPTQQVKVVGVNEPTLSTDLALLQIGGHPSEVIAVDQPTDAFPVDVEPPEPVVLTLVEALQVGATNSRQYQDEKERVYLSALRLDLERDQFEFRFGAVLDADAGAELEGEDVAGLVVSPSLDVSKAFKNGIGITSRIGVDLAKLLTGSRPESLGIVADTSIVIPLLRGAGVEVVTEDLQQAERDVIYAIWRFERFKREFAVATVSRYFDVLVARDQISNAAATLRRLSINVARSQALFETGRLPGVQLDLVRSNELAAQSRLIRAEQRYEQSLDQFKVFLGLPADAFIVLDDQTLVELEAEADSILGQLAEDGRGPDLGDQVDPEGGVDVDLLDRSATTLPVPAADDPPPEPVLEETTALVSFLDRVQADRLIRLALRQRLDLAATYGRVLDAQRQTVVAADGLEGVFNIVGGASYGSGRGLFSGAQPDGTIDFGEGSYRLGIDFALPIERTAERNNYRRSLIALEQAVRDAQAAEDGVKADVRQRLRVLRTAAEDLRIQFESIRVAQRRLEAANMLVDEGRGNTRDLTEAEDDLTDAQDDFIRALVDYRVAELELQRDTGVLQVGPSGLFEETPLEDPSAATGRSDSGTT